MCECHALPVCFGLTVLDLTVVRLIHPEMSVQSYYNSYIQDQTLSDVYSP